MSPIDGRNSVAPAKFEVLPRRPHLWVVESVMNAVTGFTVKGGTLTPRAAIAGPGGTTSGIVN